MKCVRILNSEKIPSAIRSLGSNKEISDKLNVNNSTVSNWISGTRQVSTYYIIKILEVFKDIITPEQLGVEVYENEDTFHTRFKELKEENKLTQTQLAESLGYSESTISNWITGKSVPTFDDVQNIACYFDISVLYLLGETNVRNADNEDIARILQCSEHLLEFIKNDSPFSNREFMGMLLTANELEESYFDIKDEVLGNVQLLSTLKAECDREINYYTSKLYYNKFEDVINQTEVFSQSIEQPTRFEIEQLSHINICKALSRAFDEYVSRKLTEIYKKDEKFKSKYTGKEADRKVTNDIKQQIGRYYMK